MKLILSLSLTALCSLSFGAQIVLNQNAIVNPGAELGAGSPDGNDILSVPGWITTGNFTSVQYGASAAPVVAPGPGFGANFFSGGPNNPTNNATQIIDVSNLASSIDSGQIAYVLSGYFGGYLFQNDNASLFATFFNGSNTSLGISTVIGGFNSTSRADISQLLFDSGTGFIPVGTRSVLITLEMTRTEGFYNDGYADNVSFVATALNTTSTNSATPEPSTLALSGLGVGALWMLRKIRSPH
jgi:PEP-CTERM motif